MPIRKRKEPAAEPLAEHLTEPKDVVKKPTKKKPVKAPKKSKVKVEEETINDPTANVKITRDKGASDLYVDAVGSIVGWEKAVDVFDRVTSVETIFPDFNRASTVGGLAVRRMHTIHGPTHGGKTAFVLGLVKSFVDAGHYAGYIDAEHTLGQEFVEEMIADIQNKPNFLGSRPSTYEETIEKVDGFLKKIGAARKTNPDLKSILVVDSINKLVPARELKKVLEEGKDRKGNDKGGGAELSKGHQGRYRAAVNQAWLDHLTPLLAEADCALCIIAQERDEEATSFFKKEDDVKVKGGKALLFDASMVIRVSKASPIYFKDSDKTNAGIAGFAHRVRVWKSKVGHMDGRHSDCVFYLSNGKFSKPGFDHAREALTMGVKLGLVNQSGAWFSYDGRRQQGMNSAIEYLNKNPERLVKLLSEVNNAIREKRPTT